MMLRQKVSENIKKARKASGLNQTDFARAVDVCTQMVSKWENGHAAPDWDSLEKNRTRREQMNLRAAVDIVLKECQSESSIGTQKVYAIHSRKALAYWGEDCDLDGITRLQVESG